MPQYRLENLNRQEYIDSTSHIEDPKSIAFANMAKEWWDRHFSWRADPCVVLCDEQGEHLCYIFYKIDRYKEYLSIHNIFTPYIHRRQGFAYELLSQVFDEAVDQHVLRFKLTSISKSLDFYLSLGFIYWGVNSVGDYICDLPIPSSGLEGVDTMVENHSDRQLLGKKSGAIYKKVAGNSEQLTQMQQQIYDEDMKKLHKHYRETELETDQKHP